jgi:hypothetical protein
MAKWESVVIAANPVSGVPDAALPLSGVMSEAGASLHADILWKRVRQVEEALIGAVDEWKTHITAQARHKDLYKTAPKQLVELSLRLDKAFQS